MTLNFASKSYEAFKAAVAQKSKETEKTYDACLWSFIDYRNFTNPDSLCDGTQTEKEDAIKAFIKDKSYTMANKTVWALTMFYSANRILLDWNHVRMFMPKQRDNPEGELDVYRPYTKEEISTIWRFADKRQLLASGIMATAGPRVAALPGIKYPDDVVFMEAHKLYAIKFYSYSKNDAYWSFVTPQVTKLLDDYVKHEHKGKSKYLFVFKNDPEWHVSSRALIEDNYRLLKKAGLRTPGEDSDTQMNHGYRKFFRTQLEVSKVNDDAAERLMGHNSKRLKRIYSMPTPAELLEATEYYKAIPALTF